MAKLLGSVLVILVSTLLGFQIAKKYADRPKQLRQFITAMQVLETEIFYAATALPFACLSIGARIPAPIGSFFQAVGEKLRDGRGLTVDSLWQETLTEHKSAFVLKEADREVLQNFGRTLGVSDREDQIKHIHLVIAHLQAQETIARDEQARNEKMWKSLGVLFGLTVVILFY